MGKRIFSLAAKLRLYGWLDGSRLLYGMYMAYETSWRGFKSPDTADIIYRFQYASDKAAYSYTLE